MPGCLLDDGRLCDRYQDVEGPPVTEQELWERQQVVILVVLVVVASVMLWHYFISAVEICRATGQGSALASPVHSTFVRDDFQCCSLSRRPGFVVVVSCSQ